MTLNRRQFTGSLGMLMFSVLSGNALSSCMKGAGNKVDSISLYMVNVTKARNFSHSTWHNRQHIFVAMKSGKYTGWSEVLAIKNELDFDVKKWGKFMKPLIGQSIDDAIEFARQEYFNGNWKARNSESVLMGLYDLLGRAANSPTIDLWGLTKREPVPGLFCILEKDVNQALIQAEIAKEQKLTSHVKVKMFGDTDLDLDLTRALRESFGESTFLMADANRGYKEWKTLDELSSIMKNLQAAGLNAMEDPAEMTKKQWIELQSKVGEFILIPDRPMRPAHKSLEFFHPEMGHCFNIHPDTMGTFKEMNTLAAKIRESGKGLMIGDSSFIGPACSFWSQIAIGNGASWVEAIEKPQESDVFSKCVTDSSTKMNDKGEVELIKNNPGFGLTLDEVKLRELSDKYETV